MRVALFSCFIGIVLVSSLAAAPVFRTEPPGQPPTTHQVWTFDDSDDPAPPEIDNNTYGLASIDIDPIGQYVIDPGWYAEYLGRLGVWHGNMVDLYITIPNRLEPDDYKEIWIEIGGRGDIVANAVLDPPAGATLLEQSELPDGLTGWEIFTIGWYIEPNPAEETIYLSILDSGADIDYIIIDTICIPEPATIFLLGLGGLLIGRKYRA